MYFKDAGKIQTFEEDLKKIVIKIWKDIQMWSLYVIFLTIFYLQKILLLPVA
jgi:hypothetical protein